MHPNDPFRIGSMAQSDSKAFKWTIQQSSIQIKFKGVFYMLNFFMLIWLFQVYKPVYKSKQWEKNKHNYFLG